MSRSARSRASSSSEVMRKSCPSETSRSTMSLGVNTCERWRGWEWHGDARGVEGVDGIHSEQRPRQLCLLPCTMQVLGLNISFNQQAISEVFS